MGLSDVDLVSFVNNLQAKIVFERTLVFQNESPGLVLLHGLDEVINGLVVWAEGNHIINIDHEDKVPFEEHTGVHLRLLESSVNQALPEVQCPCPSSIRQTTDILGQLEQPLARGVNLETKRDAHEDVGLEVCLGTGKDKVNGPCLPALDDGESEDGSESGPLHHRTEGLPKSVGCLLASMCAKSGLVFDEFPTRCSLALEGPDSLDDVKLDSFGLEFIDDSCRDQLPMLPLCEVIDFLVHPFLELVPVRLSSGFTQMHGVRITFCCSKGMDERMDVIDGSICKVCDDSCSDKVRLEQKWMRSCCCCKPRGPPWLLQPLGSPWFLVPLLLGVISSLLCWRSWRWIPR